MKSSRNEVAQAKEPSSPRSAGSGERLNVCGLILCAGAGTRTGLPYNKLLHYVGKKTVLETTLDRFAGSDCTSVLLVVSETDRAEIAAIAKNYPDTRICLGGATRAESVRRGLKAIGLCDIVVIHDGARPYVSEDLINRTIASAKNYGSGILAVPAIDTMKEVSNGEIVRTLIRDGLYHAQTPQSFVYPHIADAYGRILEDCYDDSEVFLKAGYSPRVVLGDYSNIKITTQEDYLRPASIRTKIGIGFDVHPLVGGRPLVLGGLRIPHEKGPDGHSDADVLTHAVMDALLSAADLPDIGGMFPDTDPRYKDIASTVLLSEVQSAVTRRGFRIENISAVVMAQRPKLAPYIPEIRLCLSAVLGIGSERINISATTTEELGIIGEEKGIASSASCLLSY